MQEYIKHFEDEGKLLCLLIQLILSEGDCCFFEVIMHTVELMILRFKNKNYSNSIIRRHTNQN